MRPKEPTVSVIIPTYNRAHLITRSIKSVLDQTFQDFEIIIVDDASIDCTESVIKNFKDPRIKYLKNETNKGAGASRNKGIKCSVGEYIAFHDSDDEWHPEKLEKQMDIFSKYGSKYDVVYTDMLRVYEDNTVKYWHSPTMVYKKLINEDTMDYQARGIGIQSTLIRKGCFEKTGFLDEKFPRFIDLELFIRLSNLYRFYLIKEPLVKYYSTPGISSNDNAMTTARKLILEKHYNEIKKEKKFLRKECLRIGIDLMLTGEIDEGRSYIIHSIKSNPLNPKGVLMLTVSHCGQKSINRTLYAYSKMKSKLTR